MQTFLPYPDFAQSARHLDSRRLGKQRVECVQILRTLTTGSGSWLRHPAVLMWAGHDLSLLTYFGAIVDEWSRRGHQNNMITGVVRPDEVVHPPWLGDDRLHSSHRAALLYKDPEYYASFGWQELPRLRYYWP